jgi:hypothetical protein
MLQVLRSLKTSGGVLIVSHSVASSLLSLLCPQRVLRALLSCIALMTGGRVPMALC